MELELGASIGGLATAAAGVGLVLTARQIRLSREADERINRWRRVKFVRSVINQLDADDLSSDSGLGGGSSRRRFALDNASAFHGETLRRGCEPRPRSRCLCVSSTQCCRKCDPRRRR
jgi:hypothetical protein